LIKPFRQPNPKGEYVIRLVLGTPKNWSEIQAELEKLRNNPEDWL